jgi:pimeloyl-ACP methyl ester carboxylesterase/DNA-binding CsgD family transcriptional regulator/PAS domain-containing protein
MDLPMMAATLGCGGPKGKQHLGAKHNLELHCLSPPLPQGKSCGNLLRMTDAKPAKTTAQFAERDQKAEIVDRLYDVALDPVRLEELLDVWESSAAPLRVGVMELDDPEIAAHLSRATVFLDRYEAQRPDARFRAVLADIPRAAAFLSDGGAQIVACNRAATIAFGIREGGAVDDLPFESEDVATLRRVARKVAQGGQGEDAMGDRAAPGEKAGPTEKMVILRIRSQTTGSPVLVRVSPVESASKAPLALILSTELVWPPGFATTVQEAFGLTLAEVEIVQGITLGLPLRNIADDRGRSVETVRTQLRSILSKTETHSQSELVRVVLGLMDVAFLPAGEVAPAPPAPGRVAEIPFSCVTGPDGRRLEYLTFGAAKGRAVLYMHLDFGFVRWPARAERAAAQQGLRIIVPVRAGYGRTPLHPKGRDHIAGVVDDYAAVLDHLGVSDVVVIPMGADLRFALALAAQRPGLVRGIVGAACMLPARTAAQYERMDKWQRFVLANARYAPKVLPFLVKAGFSLARRLGKAKFFMQVNGGSAADMAAFALPEVRDAVLAGSDVCMSATHLAHEAFTRECISSERDWSALIRANTVPVKLLQGDQDPQSPVQTIRELAADFPQLDVEFLPDTGQLLLFTHWPRVLEEVKRMIAGAGF